MTLNELNLLRTDQLVDLYVSLRSRPGQNPDTTYLKTSLPGFHENCGYMTYNAPSFGLYVFLLKCEMDFSQPFPRTLYDDALNLELSPVEIAYLDERFKFHGLVYEWVEDAAFPFGSSER